MAGQVSKQELGTVLMQAMLAQKNIGPHRDRLLELRRRLQQQPRPSGDFIASGLREFALDVEHIDPAFAGRLQKLAVKQMYFAATMKHLALAPHIVKVHFIGLTVGARYLTSCLEIAAANGALNPAFAVMPDEQLYDELLAQRLPARPTTQTEALSRVEAALYAVKLAQEHHLPRCIEELSAIGPPSVTGEPEDEDDPVAAATEHLAKIDLSDDPATGEPPQAAAKRSGDVETAREYLDRACTLLSLAVSHMDLAVAVLSSFLDPKEVASLSEYTDRAAAISEEYFLQFN